METTETPERTESAHDDYINHDLRLVALRPGQKRPRDKDWNKAGHGINDASRIRQDAGIGLHHLDSGTCCIDIDDWPSCEAWFSARDIDLKALLNAPDAVQIKSGRDARAKLLYRLPEGADWLPYVQPADGKLELRCANAAGSSQQDVIPPSIHPDTGRPYEWIGDWKRIPTLPDDVLDAWIGEHGAERAKPANRPHKAAQGGESVIDAYNAAYQPGVVLAQHGYRQAGKRWIHPNSESKSFGVVALPDSSPVSVYSHHGSDPLANGHSHDAFSIFCMLEHDGDTSAAVKAAARALGMDAKPKGEPKPAEPRATPKNPDILKELPHGLGAIQRYIYGRQVYPDMATAGVAALATVTMFAQSRITVDSMGGLGLNEQYMVLAPTGFGKESIRRAIARLHEDVTARSSGNLGKHLPHLLTAAPASKQGLHNSLEEHSSLFYSADEFGEWLAASNNDSHKREALGYLMQIYTSALSSGLTPGNAVTREYTPIDKPRVSVLATSTAERMVEAMSASQADSGAFNRWVMFLPSETPTKRYEDFCKEPDGRLIDLLSRIADTETTVRFSREAWDVFVLYDSTVMEPLKGCDYALAGRLSEQAIKIAALIALSDDRHEISARDLEQAYAIREGMYRPVFELMRYEGAFSGSSATGDAIEQVADKLREKGTMPKSQLHSVSRKYRALSAAERHAVINALLDDGRAIEDGKHLQWGGDGD